MKFNLDPGKLIGGFAGIVIPHILGSHGYECLPRIFHFILPVATCVLGAHIGHDIYMWVKAKQGPRQETEKIVR